jgi:hypothetical protein
MNLNMFHVETVSHPREWAQGSRESQIAASGTGLSTYWS